MIEVGKVVTRQARTYDYGNLSEESVSVNMDASGIALGFNTDFSERLMLHKDFLGMMLTSEQAIELGQILLKAAECQTEYAAAAALLDEERIKLDTRYKDMISGLGLDVEVDVDDSHNTFKVITAS